MLKSLILNKIKNLTSILIDINSKSEKSLKISLAFK